MSRRSSAAPPSRTLRRHLGATVLLLAATASAAACGGDDATSPNEAITGTYVLNGPENGTLPFTVAPITFGGGVEITGATLALEANGVARDVRRFREVTAGGDVVRTFSDSTETTWRVEGEQVLVDRPFPPSNPVAARLHVDSGTVTGGPLRLRVRYPFSNSQTQRVDTTFVYVRATAP